MNKLTSRKFWICVAAFFASVATSVAGIKSDNQTVLIIGTICGILSAAIYAFCEAWVDGKAVKTSEYYPENVNANGFQVDNEETYDE